MRLLVVAALSVSAAGCISLPSTKGLMEAEPAPFPHPGTFSGSLSNGILAYKVNADGTGKSCFRDNFNNGRIMESALVYDGERIHTENGTANVTELSENRIGLKHSFIDATLVRGRSVPAGCQDFLASRSGDADLP